MFKNCFKVAIRNLRKYKIFSLINIVGLAIGIAWPVAYLTMNKWLQDFAYRVEVGWCFFALAGGLALVIALLTVSTPAVKSALKRNTLMFFTA